MMRNSPSRSYLPHNQHLHQIPQRPLVRQKSITNTPIQTQPTTIKTHLSSIQNLEMIRKDYAKVKIQFNYTPSTPKFGEEENLSVKTGNSSPKTNLSPQKSVSDIVKNSSTGALLEAVEQNHPAQVIQSHQFSKPILRQHKMNSHLVQKRKEVKSKTLSKKYEVIAEVLPTLEVSRHERDEEMISLKRELNETRSQNNQLRTQVLRWEKKFELTEEKHRNKTEELIQQIKELRIELQKAQNDKLLAQVSEAELEKKIKKMMEENAQREKLQKVREDYLLSPFQSKKQGVYQNNISYQPYIQLFVHQAQ